MDDLLIKNGRLIDPANSMDAKMDILVSKDKIVTIAPKISAKAKTTIDANKLWVTPGLIDIHVHFREPGYEYKETIESAVITYLKDNNLYEDILNESREIPEVYTDDKFVMNCFGVDVFENNGELKSEFDYAKTL